MAYKIGSLWAGQEGSLLLWTWILCLYSSAAVFSQRHRHNQLLPIAIPVMMITAAFFLYLNNFSSNPFAHLVAIHAGGGESAWAPQDGRGLNPLLQHPAMVIHPPILYAGYIGFVVPFAFAVAALWTRQLGSTWIYTIRRWTLFSWAFLAGGILLGAKWAYVELGWGGYWAWDPVENASLMPWLTGTAFLHSVIVQEKRGMLKIWNVSLVCLTFILCILGTFLTRSGVVSSVHSFARSDIGLPFAIFIVSTLIFCTVLILKRLPYLRSENQLTSVLSRESGFLFNNLLFLAAAFSVLFGTVFPILSELATGRKIAVGQAYFNKVEVPLGLLLLFLVGAGPLLAYRRTSVESLRKNFLVPVVLGILMIPACIAMGVKSIWAMISISLCVFVTATIIQEFHKGTTARMRSVAEGYLPALIQLTRRNNRRYGGYIVHFGMVLLFLGLTGSAFVREGRGILGIGDDFSVGEYTIRVSSMNESLHPPGKTEQEALYWSGVVNVDVFRGETQIATLDPEKRYYIANEQPSSEVAIHQSAAADLYLVYAGQDESGKAIVQAYVNPLVMWVWIGGIVMIAGTFFCMIPPLRSRTV
jgi:cytochrome c-type biogenesis protein CcmF